MTAELKLMPRPLEKSVEAALDEAKGQGFETVIVLGFKGGQSFIRSSNWKLNRMEMLGALEYAKHHVWEA